MNNQPIIRFDGVTKKYDQQSTVLNNVSFELERGKFYTLLVPSGCGKTTILRLIAGFIEPSKGTILFNEKKINDVPANERKVNTAFQDYALFPHLNVFENVAFGLCIKKVKKDEVNRRVKEYVGYSTPNSATLKFMDFEVTGDERYYPDKKTRKRLEVYKNLGPKMLGIYN